MGLFKKMAVGIGLIFLTSHHVCPMQYLSSFNKFFKNIPGAKFVAEQKDILNVAAHVFTIPYQGPLMRPFNFIYVVFTINMFMLLCKLHVISEEGLDEEIVDILKLFDLLADDPLAYALKYNDITVLKQLIKRGRVLSSAATNEGITPIHGIRWSQDNSKFLNILIKEGVSLDKTCGNVYPYPGSLPVHRALYYANIDDIRLLGRAGDIKEPKNEDGVKFENIFSGMYYDYDQREDVVRVVRECMQDMEHSTQELMSAIETQDVSKAKRAIDSWAIVVRKDQYGNTLLHKVIGPYDPKKPTNLDQIARLIVPTIGRQVRKLRNDKEQTPLHIAAMQGNVRLMQLLVRFGADVDSPDIFGNTPCHYAQDLSTVLFLVHNHADLSIQNDKGELPYQALIKLAQLPNANHTLTKFWAYNLFDNFKIFFTRYLSSRKTEVINPLYA